MTNVKNEKKITEMIENTQKKATVRTISYKDIVNAVADLETALGIAKKSMEGVKYTIDVNAQYFANAYKYKPDSTQAVVERRGNVWRVLSVVRDTTGHDVYKCDIMPETTKQAILNNYMRF